MSVEFEQVRYLLCFSILAATPFFLVFGAWSDKIGRKTIMLAGMLLAIVTYRPIYKMMYSYSDVKTRTEITERGSKGVAVAVAANGDSTITTTTVAAYTDGSTLKTVKKEVKLADASKPAVKPETTKTLWLSSGGFWMIAFLVFIQIIYVTMVYGPIAAFLVELFPTRIRYTSMSLPYHIGNGIFGGLTPFIATRLFDASKTAENPGGDPYVGIWYPILIASVCFIIGLLYLPNKNDEDVND
jgi:MHS family proline/betaine transporter-like MFS transporter